MGNDEISQLIEDCETRESRMNDWERSFIDSVSRQFDRGEGLTKGQIEKIEEVWERVTANG